MKKEFHPNFDFMNELSSQGQPFFFVIDFLMNRVEVYPENTLAKSGIYFDFQNFNFLGDQISPSRNFYLDAFPMPLEMYTEGFKKVQGHLKQGNSYLINYTTKTQIETNYSLSEIFVATKAKYKLLYKNEFVCFSPETFVEIKEHTISTYPMKGTIDARIKNAPKLLKNNPKEKAEHYTVVDLLRNDLSMVADEVYVKAFQRIEFIKTLQKDLYAMSSEIVGILKPEYRNKIGSIMKRLLPAGSILGAPKPKTLEVILEAESADRGFYTGVCGWFDGRNLDSGVMIRFIENKNGKMYFKSGGGITHQSNLIEEYEEMKNKIYVPIY